MSSWRSIVGTAGRRAHRVSGHFLRRPIGRWRGSSFRLIRSAREVPYAGPRMIDTVRSLWAETRAPDPPGPAASDWALVAVVVVIAVGRGRRPRPDLVWRPFSLVVTVGARLPRCPGGASTRCGVVAIAFGTVSVVDVVALVRDVEWEGLNTAVFLLVLPYALTRWGSGREVGRRARSSSLSPCVLTARRRRTRGGDIVGGAWSCSCSPAPSASPARYRRRRVPQELAGIRSRERAELARELHDTVAHHVSAIAVRAQAGRVVAATRPEAAADALVGHRRGGVPSARGDAIDGRHPPPGRRRAARPRAAAGGPRHRAPDQCHRPGPADRGRRSSATSTISDRRSTPPATASLRRRSPTLCATPATSRGSGSRSTGERRLRPAHRRRRRPQAAPDGIGDVGLRTGRHGRAGQAARRDVRGRSASRRRMDRPRHAPPTRGDHHDHPRPRSPTTRTSCAPASG